MVDYNEITQLPEWKPNAPNAGEHFANAAAPQAQYNIYFRAINFDLHLGRIVSPEFDKNIVEKDWGIESGIAGFANHEYVEIMKREPATGKETLDTRFQGLGVVNDPDSPTGFKMTPDDRLVGIVSNTSQTPVGQDPIFHDDANFDQQAHAGQLQGVDNPGDNSLVATVDEEQMLQIKLAMLKATNQINSDHHGFGLLGQWDPNSNSFRNTMGAVVKEAADLLGVKVNADFDPDGLSPGAGQRIPTDPVKLFNGSIEELRDAVRQQEAENARQLGELRRDINAGLQAPAAGSQNGSGNASFDPLVKPMAP